MLDEIQSKTESYVGSIKLIFEDHSNYFFACVEAESVTDKLTLEYHSRIALEISRSGHDKVMIKRDVPLTKNAGDHCAVIYMVPGWQLRRIRYAFVDVNLGHIGSYDLALLFARGSGVDAEIYNDIPSAREWLLRPDADTW